MPLWRIAPEGPTIVQQTEPKQENLLEEHLEDWLMSDPSILEEPLLIIGRQVVIPDLNDRLDILALDPQGNAVVVELKRGKLSDPVDMQALRYASYISRWPYEGFESQARTYLGQAGNPDFNFNELYEQFCADAGVDEAPDINLDQRMILVGAEVRDRLGSVALWLREHNIDIKVVEVELFRLGDTMLLEPHVIIPLPVDRFRDTGRSPGVDPSRPWTQNGRAWHLDRRCSPTTRQMLLTLNDIIRDHTDVDGPRWSQKFYVAYRIGNRNWLTVETRSTMLRLRFLVRAGALNATAMAESLSVEEFDKEDPLAEKLGLPSSVLIQSHSEATDRVILRLKEEFDLGSDAFAQFLEEAHEAFPR